MTQADEYMYGNPSSSKNSSASCEYCMWCCYGRRAHTKASLMQHPLLPGQHKTCEMQRKKHSSASITAFTYNKVALEHQKLQAVGPASFCDIVPAANRLDQQPCQQPCQQPTCTSSSDFSCTAASSTACCCCSC